MLVADAQTEAAVVGSNQMDELPLLAVELHASALAGVVGFQVLLSVCDGHPLDRSLCEKVGGFDGARGDCIICEQEKEQTNEHGGRAEGLSCWRRRLWAGFECGRSCCCL